MNLLFMLFGAASAGEYRHLSLVDGRKFVGEIEVSGDREMDVAVPQGRMRVGFTDVLAMTAATEAEWHGQPSWRVLLSPLRPADGVDEITATGAERALRQALLQLPAITVLPPPSEAEAFGLKACGLDVGCARTAIPARDVDIMIVGVVGNPSGAAVELALASIWTESPAAARRASVLQPPGQQGFANLAEVSAAMQAVLGLVPAPPSAPDPPIAAPEVLTRAAPMPTPPVPEEYLLSPGLVYAPVPGLPAFAGGAPQRGLAAWAIAIPLAGSFTWIAGEVAHEPAEFAVATAVGAYLSIVLANVITQPESVAKGVPPAGEAP